ncbi:MAG: protein kinase [candidate division NC10 bacterium]|nr:protein kinase [candidate division NC10 bacterium]
MEKDWPGWLGLVIAALVLLWLLAKVLMWLAAPHRAAGRLSRAQARRAAKRAAGQGDHLEAGRLFEMAEEWAAAAEAYERAQAYREAAALTERLGQAAKAVRLYEAGGQFGRAADLAFKAGSPAKAAVLYQKAGDDRKAAESLERAGEPERAAVLYTKLEAFERAGALRLQLGQTGQAAELLERHLDRLRLRSEGDEAPDSLRARQEAARRCAALYGQAGDHARAAQVLAAHHLEADAAEARCLAGDWETGLESLLRHRQFERAAALCQAHGRDQDHRRVLAEQHAVEGRDGEAAQAFEAVGLWWRAGELYEKSGKLTHAGEMYERHGDEERAAEMFAAAQEPARAAVSLERLGKWAEAARYYQQAGAGREAARVLRLAGDLYGAAQTLLQLQAVDEALPILQQIPPGAPEYRQATLQLGDLFLRRGLLGPAREKFDLAVSLATAAPDLVHPCYQLGVIAEQQGEHAEALRFFEKVIAERLDYRDVQARVSALRRQRSATGGGARGGAATRLPAGQSGATRLPTGGGRYRILRELGRGGMGVVYQAEDTVLQRQVAYKVLPGAIRDDPKALEYFLREARIAASLQHPNIVTIYDAGQSGGHVYIAMEFVEGRSVESLLDEQGTLPLPQALDLFRQACRSLAHAHAQRVVHRDVKPGNMMLTKAGLLKLMDFGLAAVVTQATSKVTSIRGTPFYMAPEQILGRKLAPAADQYALGCTLHHLVTGRPPFVDGDVLYHHIHTAPAAPCTWNPRIPAWLDAIILRTMQKDPATRFPSVATLLGEVESCLGSARSKPMTKDQKSMTK